MPTYKFLCKSCNSKFEINASIKEKEEKDPKKFFCPKCKSTNIKQNFSFGILLGIVGGMILQRTGLDKDIIGVDKKAEEEYLPKTLSGKLEYAISETASILKRIFPYILIRIKNGGFFYGYVPNDFLKKQKK